MQVSTFNPSLSALSALVALVGVRAGSDTAKQNAKIARHAAIVCATAQVVALHLCAQPPKGKGNPADAGKLVATFQHAGMKAYAEHATAIRAALAQPEHKGRSIAEWVDAVESAELLVKQAFAGCAPKQYTAAELKAKAEKREANKAKREAADTANKAAETKAAAERAQAEALQTLTGEVVAAIIKSGGFTSADLDAIKSALVAIGEAQPSGEPVTA